MPRLKLLKGTAGWSEHALEADLEVIGRTGDQATIVLEDGDNFVSRRHAEIIRNEGQYFIQDYGRSGTTLNNRRLVKGKRYLLSSNDLIQICNYVLTFLEGSDEYRRFGEPFDLIQDDSSSFSQILDLSSGSWRTRKGVNPEAKLSAIMELTQNLRNCKSLDELLGKALGTLLTLFPQAYRGVVVLTEMSGPTSTTRVVRYHEGEDEEMAVISTGVINDVMSQQAAALSDSELLMCAPLIGDGQGSLGVILLDSHRRMFSHDDLDLFATVAEVLAIAVENRVLHEGTLSAREMQLELKVAKEVQIGLLPAEAPHIESYEFFDYYSPAKKVGGDYYDYIKVDDDRLAVVLGDVAGKGIPAALFMAKVASELGVFLAGGSDPVSVLHRLNPRFDNRNPRNTFVTMVLASLDYSTHEITLVNAGHMPPLLRKAGGTIEEVGRTESGLPVGVEPTYEYQDVRFAMGPGEVLVLYSDGVTDAQNGDGQRYQEKRLRASLAQASGDASSVGEQIMNDIHAFVGDAQQVDDICLLCISRSGEA